MEYLKRNGKPMGLASPLETGGYSLTKDLSASTFTTPKTNEPYSMVSGDFNPYVLQC
jgi:fatty acid synthase subunit beta